MPGLKIVYLTLGLVDLKTDHWFCALIAVEPILA